MYAYNKSRLEGRHGEDGPGADFTDLLVKMYALYEPAGDDEANAYNVTITEDMSPDDVIGKVLEITQKL